MRSYLAAAVLIASGSAHAEPIFDSVDHSNHTIYGAASYQAITLGSPQPRGSSSAIFSNMEAGSGFQAFPASSVNVDGEVETIGADDYTSTAIGSTTLTEFRFVGGVQEAGGVIFVDFFDAAGAAISGFGVQLADAGNFVYTITINTTVEVADAGFVQISVDDDGQFGSNVQTTGQWFLSDAAATIGANGPAGGASSGALNHNFELTTVPAPGAAAMLGLTCLMAGRRRR